MDWRHPFEWLSVSAYRRAFVLLLVLTLALMAMLQVLGEPLKSDAAPAGIVSFEFAGDLATAKRMVKSWGEAGRVYAGLNLGLDYLFLVAYPLAIGLGCVLVARGLDGWGYRAGVLLAWGQLAAGLLDATENYALIRILLGAEREWLAALAAWCAAPKFALVGAGIAYVLVGAVVLATRRGGRIY